MFLAGSQAGTILAFPLSAVIVDNVVSYSPSNLHPLFGVELYSTIFRLAVLDYSTGLKLAFVVA